MTQIANVRRFDGVDDWLKLTSTDFTVASFGAMTFLAIVKTDIANDTGYGSFLAISGGTGGEYGFDNQDRVGGDSGISFYFDAPGIGWEESGWFTPAMGWCLVGFTKADGTVFPRMHRYRYDTTTWTHTDHGATSEEGPVPTGTPNMYIGTWNEAIQFLDADVAVVGAWMGTALSDGQIEGLKANIAAWDALSPTGLWLLNQTSVADTVLDRVGSGDQIGRNGTSAVTPTGLTFDIGGVGRIYKRLYGPAHLGTAATSLYTTPTGVKTTIRRIWANNPSGSPVDFTFSIGADAAGTRLYDSENISAGGEVEEARDHTLEPGEMIQASAGSGSTVVLVVDGYEESL